MLAGVGGPAEQLSIVDPAEAAGRGWPDPNVVLCLADLDRTGEESWCAGGEPVPPARGWALAQDAFTVREGVAGSPELRALALARLGPRPGALIWDVAAGSGALGVEAARLGAAVISVENDPGLCVRIVANAKRHGVDLRLVDAALPGALTGLPQPDAVFIGTTRTDVVRACAGRGAQRIVVEVHELGTVGPVRDTLVDAGYAVDGRLLFTAPSWGCRAAARRSRRPRRTCCCGARCAEGRAGSRTGHNADSIRSSGFRGPAFPQFRSSFSAMFTRSDHYQWALWLLVTEG